MAKKAANQSAANPGNASMTKIFVLDTNVLLHDPTSVYRFEEHDVFLPIMTLEELDNNKKGMSEVSRNARQVTRTLDEIVSSHTEGIENGIDLAGPSKKLASGKLFLQTMAISSELPTGLPTAKADNQILSVLIHLQRHHPERAVILVSKDINMRIKARALGLAAQDYFNDKVLEDTDLLYTGVRELSEDFWDTHGQGMESWKRESRTLYRVRGPLCPSMLVNEFIYQEGERPLYAIVRKVEGNTAEFETLTDYTHPKNSVWGITARNREQNFALNLLMDPEVDFVSLLGQAGTGKTLLTLAAALTQVLDTKRYSEIIMTRVTVPVGEDIGFLPGTEEEKMMPWLAAVTDTLEVLHKQDENMSGSLSYIMEKANIQFKSVNFMRGRSIQNTFVLLDECQNLTASQIKTIITRCGEGTKIVCSGNLAQIDSNYLSPVTSGLTYIVERFKDFDGSANIFLNGVVRSRLASFAEENL